MMNYRSFAQAVKNKSRYIYDSEVTEFLSGVRSQLGSHVEIIKKGSMLYRAQLGYGYECTLMDQDPETGEGIMNPVAVPHGQKRLTPNPALVTEGRANPRGIAYFYAATNATIAMHEIRPWIGADVTVGHFQLTKDVRIINLFLEEGLEVRRRSRNQLLRAVFDGSGGLVSRPLNTQETKEELWDDINEAFALPVPKDEEPINYIPTQIIAELVKSEDYDGIGYKSVFSNDADCYGDDGVGANLVLFDISAVQLLERSLYTIKGVCLDPGNPERSPGPGDSVDTEKERLNC